MTIEAFDRSSIEKQALSLAQFTICFWSDHVKVIFVAFKISWLESTSHVVLADRFDSKTVCFIVLFNVVFLTYTLITS